MTVLAIDPGLERIGYAVVHKNGSILTPLAYGLIQTPRIDLPLRLKIAHDEVKALLQTHAPDALAIEKLFFTKNQTTAFDVAKALGCILLAAAEYNLPVTEYTPPQVKKAVTGVGNATKSQVQFMVTRILSLKETPKPDDVADAIAIAVAHALATPPTKSRR